MELTEKEAQRRERFFYNAKKKNKVEVGILECITKAKHVIYEREGKPFTKKHIEEIQDFAKQYDVRVELEQYPYDTLISFYKSERFVDLFGSPRNVDTIEEAVVTYGCKNMLDTKETYNALTELANRIALENAERNVEMKLYNKALRKAKRIRTMQEELTRNFPKALVQEFFDSLY